MASTHTTKAPGSAAPNLSAGALRGRTRGLPDALLRLPADVVEAATMKELLRLIRTPQVVAETIRIVWRKIPSAVSSSSSRDRAVLEPLGQSDPAEQARMIRLLVQRVIVQPHGRPVTLRVAGLGQIAREMMGQGGAGKAAWARSTLPSARSPTSSRSSFAAATAGHESRRPTMLRKNPPQTIRPAPRSSVRSPAPGTGAGSRRARWPRSGHRSSRANRRVRLPEGFR